MRKLLTVLNNIHHLSPELKIYLGSSIKSQFVPKNSFLLKEGNINRHIYFICKGLLRCYYLQGDREVCSRFLLEGDIAVSTSSFFMQQESDEYIQTLEPSEVLYICYDDVQYMYRNFPEFNTISRLLTAKSYLRNEQRLRLITTKEAALRYRDMVRLYPNLVQRVPGKFLAGYLGITKETLSRIRRQY
jgi:CRP/FNR family transcriptional regulator, anaerobic regulatory protein